MLEKTLIIVIKSIISLFILFLTTKLLGKKQASELSLFDYTIGISIGNFTSEIVLNFDIPFILGAVPIITFGILGWIISYLTLKNNTIRKIVIGNPIIIINKGKIIYNSLKKCNISISNLQEQARNSGYFNLKNIDYAIMEVNGKINFLEKRNKSDKEINLIVDDKVLLNNLKQINKTFTWLTKNLNKKGYKNYQNILLVTYYKNKIKVYPKNVNNNKTNLIEY